MTYVEEVPELDAVPEVDEEVESATPIALTGKSKDASAPATVKTLSAGPIQLEEKSDLL
jgi:hypothetical protein